VLVAPDPRYREKFTQLCHSAHACGNLAPDTYLTAPAIESGSEGITTDRDDSRFKGLKWRHLFGAAPSLVAKHLHACR
jgi:hypothetical protein